MINTPNPFAMMGFNPFVHPQIGSEPSDVASRNVVCDDGQDGFLEEALRKEHIMAMSEYMGMHNGPMMPQYTVAHQPQPPVSSCGAGTRDPNIIDPYIAAEIASIVHTLTSSQLLYICASLKTFLQRSPKCARRFLMNNPQVVYALLHSLFILDKIEKTILPLNKVDCLISNINKAERQKRKHRNGFEEAVLTAPQYEEIESSYGEECPPDVTTLEDAPSLTEESHIIQPAPSEHVMPIVQSENAEEVPKPTFEQLMNAGLRPADKDTVDTFLKDPQITIMIQRATLSEMQSWPQGHRDQTLAIKLALYLRGVAVDL